MDPVLDNIEQDQTEPEVANQNESSTLGIRISGRKRIPTLKGEEYQQHLAERDFTNTLRSWRRQINKVQSTMVTTLDAAILQQERGKLEARMEDLSNAHYKIIDIFQDKEDGQDLTRQYKAASCESQEVFKRLDSKMSTLLLKDIDNKSSTSSRSKKSDMSRVCTSPISSCSAAFKRTERIAKAARLQAELEFHEIETREEAELQKHRDDIRKLKMVKELAVTNAEIEAVKKVEEAGYGFQYPEDRQLPIDSSVEDRLQKYLDSQMNSVASGSILTKKSNNASIVAPSLEVTKGCNVILSDDINYNPTEPRILSELASTPTVFVPFKLNPSAPSFEGEENVPITHTHSQKDHQSSSKETVNRNPTEREQSTTSSSENVLKNLVDLLSRRQDRDSLPRPEPEVYSGDQLRYTNWLRSFETFIERKTKDPSERLYYLSRYTSGDAKEAVSGLFQLSTEEAYAKAKKILASRFGDPFLVTDAYRKRINDWPKILPNDGPSLRKLSDFLENCNTAMTSIQYLSFLNDPDENQKILKKLPNYLVTGWSRIVDKWLMRDEDDKIFGEAREIEASVIKSESKEAMYPPFAEFCKFLKREARIACNPITSPRAMKGDDTKDSHDKRNWRDGHGRKERPNARSCATGSGEIKEKGDEQERTPKKLLCVFCKNVHELDVCTKFQEIELAERKTFVQAKGLCWGCLKWGHIRKNCKRRRTCKLCNGIHPTSLHETRAKPSDDQRHDDKLVSNCVEVFNTKDGTNCVSHSLIVPVWLHHEGNPENKRMVYALLDDQSDACFVKESTINALGVDGPEVRLKLSTVLAEETIACQTISGLVVRGVKESNEIHLPRTYSTTIIPARRGQIPRPESARKWPHLRKIASHLMPYNSDIEVGLLIGISCARAIKPYEVVPGENDEPYAKKTALGWGIIGIVDPSRSDQEYEGDRIQVNRIFACEVQPESKRSCFFALKTQVKELYSPEQVNQMMEQDFSERKSEEQLLSHEDRVFIKKVSDGIRKQNDGHYEIPLPFKQDEVKLPNNKQLVHKRLIKLKTRLVSDKRYRDDYLTFMKDIIDKGYAERVPSEELQLNNGRVWYIPHHGVYHPKKPGKIRVVFDCSAEFGGESLNRHLLQGPDLTNSLIEVLCRFRQEHVALMCDIEAMFHQVKVSPDCRNFLRFLWWENGNFNSDPVEFRMTVHLFGATSSPGCCNYALRRTAEEHEADAEVASFVKNDFYVDDGLKSVPTPDDAVCLIKGTKALCKRGGFNLHKFVSNSKDVLTVIPPKERANSLQDLDLSQKILPVERPLGIQWCVQSDTLQFRIELKDSPLTRRGILSTVSSVFDPLGLLAPLILVGKTILQELCRSGAAWDDEIPDHLRMRWQKWRNQIHLLNELKITRCYKPETFGTIKSVEIHNFSDASKDGYGQCSYLRLVDESDRVHCSLVMAKARVTPKKQITIPRLELAAALVSVKVSTQLKKALEYKEMTEVFWTDSKVVLGYISNDARRFHVYVANRVQQIRDYTSPSQWRYVKTESNPADDASRGLDAQDLLESSRWWNGPEFLWHPLEDQQVVEAISLDDPEVKRVSTMSTIVQEHSSLLERLEYFSSWHRAKRAIATCLRLQNRFKNQQRTGDVGNNTVENKKRDTCNAHAPITVQELQNAEIEIVKNIQREAFKEEIDILQSSDTKKEVKDRNAAKCRNKAMKKSSCLYRLDPFLDNSGVLRVGGRIRRANLPTNVKHPVILPRKGHMTNLVVCHHHQSVEHQGRGMTHNEIRSAGFWIIGGGSAVANHISQCTKCRKLRRATVDQKMADLPEDRLEPSPPFTYSAVDYFGPWYIKDKRRVLKRYGVLFTCLASRAIHLEVSNTMDTDSFINAYRRFVSRRGPVRQLRSDNGTNFVGAKNELKKALSEMNQDKVQQEMLKDNCDWINFKMNAPHASHMGGVWERQIRTVRSVISAILDRHGSQLDDESLRTFMTEAEAIVNSRPLTVINNTSSPSTEPLTPNHLLTMKTKVILPPPGIFQRADVYSIRRWRRVQHLSNEFWYRWRKDYLQSLQERQKWFKPRRNLEEDDVVIVKDEQLPRNKWCLGRVVETYPGSDGLVRRVKVAVVQPNVDNNGRRTKPLSFLERPVHKLILLLSKSESK